MTINKLYRKAIEKHGEDGQVIQTIQEMSELSKELTKLLICKEPDVKVILDKIAEEMADVEIMLEQLKIIFENYELVLFHKLKKQLRLERRLNGESTNHYKKEQSV